MLVLVVVVVVACVQGSTMLAVSDIILLLLDIPTRRMEAAITSISTNNLQTHVPVSHSAHCTARETL